MNEDTINLLKECNAGCKSATNSMEQVKPYIKNDTFKNMIDDYNAKHISIGDKCHQLLNESNEEEKDPSSMAKAFSWLTTEMKLMANDDTKKIAEVMYDGCQMGIKSVSQYINQYKTASDESKILSNSLVHIEQDFMKDLLEYL